MQALKTENIKVLTVNPAQTSTHMTWDRPDSEYIPDKMIQVWHGLKCNDAIAIQVQ